MHGSMGDPLCVREFPGQNGKVGTYEAVDSFPKVGILISMWLPYPLGNAPKFVERLQKNCLKGSHLPLCSETYSPVKLQLKLNCNIVFAELAK